MAHQILRLPKVLQMRGRSRSSHYLDIHNGFFTHPVAIGPRSVGWPISELEAIQKARIAGKTDSEIKALVLKLEAERNCDKEAGDGC